MLDEAKINQEITFLEKINNLWPGIHYFVKIHSKLNGGFISEFSGNNLEVI